MILVLAVAVQGQKPRLCSTQLGSSIFFRTLQKVERAMFTNWFLTSEHKVKKLITDKIIMINTVNLTKVEKPYAPQTGFQPQSTKSKNL